MRNTYLALIFLSFISVLNAQTKAYPYSIIKGLTESCIDIRRADHIVIAHQKDVTVSYYSNFNNAISQTNPLTRFYSPPRFPFTVYARVTSILNSSYAISEIIITTETCCPPPPLGIYTYDVCDFGNDGVEDILLDNLGVDRGSGFSSPSFCGSEDDDIVKTYYLTQDDANNNINPIAGPLFTISSDLTIYNKIENVITNESNVNSFEVHFVSCSGNDSDSDGIEDENEDPNNDYYFTNDDTDQDGIANYLDDDDDGDGILTIDEDSNNNGNPADDDTDNNDIPDYLENSNAIELPIVNFADEVLKGVLLYTNCVDVDSDGTPDIDADLNNDGEIQVSEALAVTNLIFRTSVVVVDVLGIESFLNLKSLDFGVMIFFNNDDLSTLPTNLDFTTLTELEFLYINYLDSIALQNIDLSGLANLQELNISNIRPVDADSYDDPNAFVDVNLEGCSNLQTLTYVNSFLNFDFCEVPSITYLDCSYLEGGEPEFFDFSCLTNLETLNIDENEVDKLILKNGSVLTNLPLVYGIYGFANYICVDDDLSGEIDSISELIGPNTIVNSYCSNVPGGEYYVTEGVSHIDSNTDGCDAGDAMFPSLKFNVSDGVNSATFISDDSGIYSIPLTEGAHTIKPVLENPEYFTIFPTNFTVDFPLDGSPYAQDFCITPIAGLNDLEVTVIPITLARPGFDGDYKIVYKNKGSTALTGSVVLLYQDDIMDLLSANPLTDNQTSNELTWNYNNLLPFETREILFTMTINTPLETPSVNDGDILSFTATIDPVSGDETEADNVFELNQTVVNSFDPNDKKCLEGNIITPELVGEYVHYLIRCENTGTAEAVNIVIKDVIDVSKFDISTLNITNSSHFMTTEINDNVVEFIFENINLPFDDANNDGFVAFKIKTLPTLEVGEIFENNAEIYFDFNSPIVTNIVSTEIVENSLGTNENRLENSFKFYPNPTNDIIYLATKLGVHIRAIKVFSIEGKLFMEENQGAKEIDLKSFPKGIYFLNVVLNNRSITKKS